MIRPLFIVFLLLAVTFQCLAAKWTDMERTLFMECEKAIAMRDYDSLVASAMRLGKEATMTGNQAALHISSALRMRGDISRHHDISNKDTADSLGKVLDSVAARDEGADAGLMRLKEMFYLHSALAFYYLYEDLDYSKASDHSFKALAIAEKMPSDVLTVDALNTLSAIYALKELPQGMEYARRSEEISRTTGNLSGQYTALVNLANYLFNEGKYEESLQYLEAAYRIAVRISLESEFTYIYSFSGDIWNRLGDRRKADDFFRKAIDAKADATFYDTGYALLRYSEFSAENGNLHQALKLALSAVDVLEGHKEVNYLRNLLLHVAQVYEAMGGYHEALDAYKRYSQLNSRLITAEKEKAFSILELKYRISEHENMEKQMRLDDAARQRRYVLIIFLCIVLAITAAFLVVMHYRNRQYYRRTIDASIRSLEKERAENTRLMESIKRRETSEGEANDKTERRIDELYGRLLILMETEKPYRDSSLSIEKTAAMLDTNRTYLSQVINSRAGCSYSVFINKARINESILLLSEKDTDISVKEVALRVGFSSLSYFNSMFKQMIGVSPGVFKNQGGK